MTKKLKMFFRTSLSVIATYLVFLIAVFLVSVIAFLLFTGTCSYFAGDWAVKEKEKFKQAVGENIPAEFPVLVITPDEGNEKHKAQLVYKKDLEDFLKKNVTYTYLVPEGQDDYLNKEIAKKYPWQAGFKVKQLPDGKQFLEVVYQWDDDHANRGWYEATDKQIFPEILSILFRPRNSLSSDC